MKLAAICYKQRWIIGESEDRRDADLKTLSKRIEQSLTLKNKNLKSLHNKEFACEADALIAAKDFEKTLNYHLLDELTILAKPIV